MLILEILLDFLYCELSLGVTRGCADLGDSTAVFRLKSTSLYSNFTYRQACLCKLNMLKMLECIKEKINLK